MTGRVIAGGILAPAGFRAGVAEAGLRASGGPDLVLLASDRAAAAAATFTTNRFRAAPVLLAERALAASGGRVRGIVVNAGSANAGTGPDGLADAERVVAAAASRIGCGPHEIIPASTGLIGSRLRVEPMTRALAALALRRSSAAAGAAARAIMTTDTRPKQIALQVPLGGRRSVRVGGMAKGSGMIHPRMATMLAFLTTDAPVAPELLATLLRPAVASSFNQISVDGDTSTNDAVVLAANGAAGGGEIEEGSPEAAALGAALAAACRALAVRIAADGEGARHLIEVHVSGARDDDAARSVARTIASSSLVKAAVHGADPNWGRIAAAAGRSGEELEMDRLRVCIGPELVFAGAPVDFARGRARSALRSRTVRLSLDLGIGPGSGVAWGCDLTPEYVTFNSEYTT